jgi:hypothetical protein
VVSVAAMQSFDVVVIGGGPAGETIAVVGAVPLEHLRHAVPPFPTRSEIWLSLLEQAGV